MSVVSQNQHTDATQAAWYGLLVLVSVVSQNQHTDATQAAWYGLLVLVSVVSQNQHTDATQAAWYGLLVPVSGDAFVAFSSYTSKVPEKCLFFGFANKNSMNLSPNTQCTACWLISFYSEVKSCDYSVFHWLFDCYIIIHKTANRLDARNLSDRNYHISFTNVWHKN